MNRATLKPTSVEVLLFAGAADAAQARSLRLTLASPATVSDVAARLGEQYPALRPFAETSRWAVDREFVACDFPLVDGAELAMIPPVSGG